MVPVEVDLQKVRHRLKMATAPFQQTTPLPGLPTRRTRVLLIGTEPGSGDRVREVLTGNGASEFELEIRSLPMSVRDRPTSPVDVILLDLGDQVVGGLTAFDEARLVAAGAPIVVLVGASGERLAAQAMARRCGGLSFPG